ncbi:MAG: hypothetical protein Q4B59_00680 [Lachnospiraceae bacterium]|nr:hypothetical protein [Lachnospiraceae bacterium]
MAKHNISSNRFYKDRLFRLLFGSEEMKSNIISLYNAINGTDYPDDTPFEVMTLDDAVYLNMKNDVAILIDSYLSLFEQQSTINPNMPLRGFMYFGNSYSSFIEMNELNIYGSSLVKIPLPKYYVLYNGSKEMAAVTKLKLSDAFIHPDEHNEFEWTATVINLNKGKNDELLAKCKPLQDYMCLIEYIRENQMNGNSFEAAVDHAVMRCIQENRMAQFLRKHRAEVLDVCITEYNEEILIKGVREEGRAEGLKEGEDNLVNAVQDLRMGFSHEQLIEKYGERTAERAIMLG